ncbi:MAG TPA: DedA family protein [Patescibacteria group bacterium]|nr:DedA family protein [Patescibacteria group bacterium]
MEEFLSKFISEYGAAGLFVWSFLSATVLPLASEGAVYIAVKYGISTTDTVIWASAGNCLACVLNYYLGVFFEKKMHGKLAASRFGRKALDWMHKHGLWSLLLSWTPFLGDPLTVVAGIARVNFFWFIVIVFSLRILRYIIVAGIV